MQERKETMARRTILGGAATVGTLAVAATLLPGQQQAQPLAGAQAKPVSDTSTGYRLSEHVKQYYATARI